MSRSIMSGRRDFLRFSGAWVAGLFAGPWLSGCNFAGHGGAIPTAPSGLPSNFDADLEISLRATQGEVSILPGKATRVWTYQGLVTKGDPASLQTLPGSYLGPILRVSNGQRVRIVFFNNLPEQSNVHWHGLRVPDDMDGHPRHSVGPGQSYVYEFQALNRAGTYWFHPHPHKLTGRQVYMGLAGLFIVSDDEEETAGLPSGKYDIPLVIQDRTFDTDNQLLYLTGGMMDQMMGFLGDRILVNGQPNFALPVETRPYRLRLLNGSNSRIYKLGWDDGAPLTVIGTDGGLLEKPAQRSYVTLAPAERADLWVNFSGRAVGSELRLQSLVFAGAEGGDSGTMGHTPALADGSEFTVMRVRVERESKEEKQGLPERLSSIRRYRLEEAINRDRPRAFTMRMQQMIWTINGRTFEMEGVADNEVAKLGALEVWEFINQPGSMGMMGGMSEEMAHPVHIHGLQFQVLERQVRPEMAAAWETVRAGYLDEGWKDTVLVMPGERVRLLVKFEDFTGLYMYHCHNLEHEDQGMMRNYRVIK